MKTSRPTLKVALIHDWMIHMRGGEKVLDEIYSLFPQSEIFTLFCDRSKLSPALAKAKIHTSFLNYLPGIRKYYRWLFPMMPFAIQSLKIKDFDLVISSSHCVAKACRVPKGTLHVCYCHTPARYIWGFRDAYFGHLPKIVRSLISLILDCFQNWDAKSSASVNAFIANSETVKQRIEKYYHRDATVIYPPVLLPQPGDDEQTAVSRDYFLVVSALVPYKRIDLAVKACSKLNLPLIVAGDGPERKRLEAIAGPDTTFEGKVSDQRLKELFRGSRALIFPGEEDFGIVPAEAQGFGRPVIAFEAGGALETVSRRSGIFFPEQSSESLEKALSSFRCEDFDAQELRDSVERFATSEFKRKIRAFIEESLKNWSESKYAETKK